MQQLQVTYSLTLVTRHPSDSKLHHYFFLTASQNISFFHIVVTQPVELLSGKLWMDDSLHRPASRIWAQPTPEKALSAAQSICRRQSRSRYADCEEPARTFSELWILEPSPRQQHRLSGLRESSLWGRLWWCGGIYNPWPKQSGTERFQTFVRINFNIAACSR